jgi:hypothetical protein
VCGGRNISKKKRRIADGGDLFRATRRKRPPEKTAPAQGRAEAAKSVHVTHGRNDFNELTFLDSEILGTRVMMYPWPLAERHQPLNEALEIAMGYLELTRQAYPYSETQVWAADAILAAWRSGVRHKIRLANYAIGAVESKKQLNGREILSFNPRAS